MPIVVISHPACKLHDMGSLHPECPARLDAIEDQLISSGLSYVLGRREAPQATREELERVHDPAYIDHVFAVSPSSGLAALDGDTSMGPHSLEAALRAAGAVVCGVDLVMNQEASAVFCAVRPPGHHAERGRAMGFCIFNNVAIGAAYALDVKGLERVAIVDFDVHHGNGTEDIFKDDARVLFCSSFQHPFYPYSGADTVNPHIINLPFPAGASGSDFRERVEAEWLPALEQFAPQLIFISAGFDGHVEDDMSDMRLREQDYAWITERLIEIAQRHADGRIVSVLEGGYALHALARSVVTHLKAFLHEPA
ncbi:MAG: histone deacetylase family protein [Rhodospirillales bacterium]|nr:histone deacetylase family protein [Rhodospirillales bacterium]